MISINLFQPNIFDIELEFPSCWNDLLPNELQYTATQLLKNQDASVIRALLLQYIIENRCRLAKQKLPEDWFLQVDVWQFAADVYPIIDFIFSTNDLTNTPDPVRINGWKMYPQTFEKITCAEYEDCEVLANKFNETPDGNLLAQLSAILFRPKNDNVLQPYLKYNAATAEYQLYKADKNLRHFAKLPPERLYANFIWYAGCRAKLPEFFPTVYESGSSSGNGPDLMAFTKCIHAGAGAKNGTREKIRTLKLYEFMFEMEQEAVAAKEANDEYERARNQQ